jgi:F0F1-type ATP synthase alpha subunit
MTDSETEALVRVHQRLDDVLAVVTGIRGDLSRIEGRCEVCSKQIETVERRQDQVDLFLHGDGSTEHVGVAGEVQSLRQSRDVARKGLLAGVSVVSAAVGAVVSWFLGRS